MTSEDYRLQQNLDSALTVPLSLPSVSELTPPTQSDKSSISPSITTENNDGATLTTMNKPTDSDNLSQPPPPRSRPGRPRIHHPNSPHTVNMVIPKVWILANFSVLPLMSRLAMEILKKGDKVVLGCCPGGTEEPELLKQADDIRRDHEDRCCVVELDTRNYALCQSTISKTVMQFGRIDVVVHCTSKIYVGALEEVEEWHMRAQMDHTFYGALNIIQACLPFMRHQFFGHFLNICDITGNIGTPLLSLLSGANHALEGYLEALACEAAPFNIKVSIIETPLELSIFTLPAVNATTELPQYGRDTPVGKLRQIIKEEPGVFPEQAFESTVKTLIAIGGLENPPGRIVVGKEAIGEIKDKLALLSEDLEEFEKISISADFQEYNVL